jgi:radical SAM protein with 4Fe4S-binding SPASM domain
VNRENMAASLQKRRDLTFNPDESIYQLIPPFPRELTLDINNRCNHRCYFCANPDIEKYAALETDLAFDLMRQGIENGCTDLALQATGEPFFDKRLPNLISEGKRLNYQYIYLNTNGALATAKRAAPVYDAGVDSVKFSINAANREDYKRVHGYDDFDKVITNLQWAYEYRNEKQLKMGLHVSFVRNSRSKIDEENLEKLIIPYCDNFDFRDVSNQGGTMVKLNETESIEPQNILGSLKQNEMKGRCVYPFNRIVVDPYGYVVPCTADFHNKLSIADTRTASLKEIWEGSMFEFLRRRHLTNTIDGIYCNQCLNNVQCSSRSLTDVFKQDLQIK